MHLNFIVMHNFVNKENVVSSHRHFDSSKDPVNHVHHWPTLSEMISESRRTGQIPFSNKRPVVETYTEDIDTSQGFESTDKVDAAVHARAYIDNYDAMEKHVTELKQKKRVEEEKQQVKQ